MNKKLLIILILGIVIFYCSCVENEKTQATQKTYTPQITPVIQTPRESPPPGVQTPPTPDYYIGKFIKYFNERNTTKLYDLFSESVRRNHSIDELEMALKFAKKHNITITKWKILKGRFWGNTTVRMTISKDGELINRTIIIPVTYKSFKRDSIILSRGYIDDWIIDDILIKD